VTPGSGLLALRVGPGASDGRSLLLERRQRFPLRVTTALHPDRAAPEMAFVYVQNPSGGVFPGDELTFEVRAEPGAAVHVTTTSATKVYGGDGDAAQLHATFLLAEGAYVEHFPDPIIPHAGSRYVEDIRVELPLGSTYVGLQGIAPGRVARGELFAFELLDLRTRVYLVSGEELCVDRLLLEPLRTPPTRRGLLGSTPYLGSIVVVAPDRDADSLAAALDRALDGVGAASPLPFDAGAIARVLASTSTELRAALGIGWTTVRQQLRGRAPQPARK
jgi:urease accessory protein